MRKIVRYILDLTPNMADYIEGLRSANTDFEDFEEGVNTGTYKLKKSELLKMLNSVKIDDDFVDTINRWKGSKTKFDINRAKLTKKKILAELKTVRGKDSTIIIDLKDWDH